MHPGQSHIPIKETLMITFRKLVLSCVALLGVATCASTANAQFNFGGGLLDIVLRPGVLHEIEATDKQKEELRDLPRTDFRDIFRSLNLEGLSDEERREAVRDKLAASEEQTEKKIEGILFPKQFQRVLQIKAQYATRNGTRGLTGRTMVEALGLTEEDIEKLREKAPEVAKEVREKTAKAQREGVDKLLSVLSASKRQKYKKLVGDPYVFQQTERRGFGRGQGDQGGRGRGDRRGNRGGRPAPDTE